MNQANGKQIYYGWKIVAAILTLLTFTSGLSFYNHAIYLNALATQPAFNVSTASAAVSIFFLSSGIAGLWVANGFGITTPESVSVLVLLSVFSRCGC